MFSNYSALSCYHEANRYDVIFSEKPLLGKKQHVEAVICLGTLLADVQGLSLDKTILLSCLEHHDDGRVDQYRLFGRFWDTDVSHNALGINRLDKFLQHNNLRVDKGIEILRQVMLYHGRIQLLADISEETKAYVELVTSADDFENACSCISYLLKELKNDEKGYIKSNPEANQFAVSDYVFSHFENGEKFDKMVWCHTYAEYVLFAATLATNCIKKYGNFAKVVLSQPGYGYSSILEGYHDIFSKALSPSMAEDAYNIISSMVK